MKILSREHIQNTLFQEEEIAEEPNPASEEKPEEKPDKKPVSGLEKLNSTQKEILNAAVLQSKGDEKLLNKNLDKSLSNMNLSDEEKRGVKEIYLSKVKSGEFEDEQDSEIKDDKASWQTSFREVVANREHQQTIQKIVRGFIADDKASVYAKRSVKAAIATLIAATLKFGSENEINNMVNELRKQLKRIAPQG